MLRALVAQGVRADFVAGVSVGAINAACFAADPTAAGVARLEQTWRSLRRGTVFPTPNLRGLFAVARGRGHLLQPDTLQQMLVEKLPVSDLAATKIPCHVVATDLISGTAVAFDRGAAVPALLASAAIPGIFPPVTIDGQRLVDGAVAYQSPFATAVEAGATCLYVLPTGYTCAGKSAPRGALGHAMHALNVLIIGKLIGSIQHFSKICDVHVVPPLCPLTVSPLDFSHSAELIDRAAADTTDWLAHGVEMEDGLPHTLAPHAHGP
jgi:NTE family protein